MRKSPWIWGFQVLGPLREKLLSRDGVWKLVTEFSEIWHP